MYIVYGRISEKERSLLTTEQPVSVFRIDVYI